MDDLTSASRLEQNALFPLEYQGNDLRASGDLSIFDLMNNPAASGKCSVFGLGFSKESLDVRLRQIGAILDDRTDTFLIRQDTV